MLEICEMLTRDPANVTKAYHHELRGHGWADEDIVDMVHVVALYSYMTRLADGLGAELEPGQGWEPLVERLTFLDGSAPKAFGKLVGPAP